MSQPLSTKYDYISHRKNHANDYVSRFPINFIGCVGCGNLDQGFVNALKRKNLPVYFGWNFRYTSYTLDGRINHH